MVRGYYRRAFLNLPRHHAGAHIIAEVDLSELDDRRNPYVDASLTIADCSRVVVLDFDSEGSRANCLRKARLLRDVLVAFVAALEGALAELDAREKAERQRRRRRSHDALPEAQ